MDWTILEDRLAQAIGLDASSLGSTLFRQAVDRRMRAREVETLSDYIRLLDADAVEFQAIVEQLVVNESWFFRHAHAFELLRGHAVATMAVRLEAFRVLSFPCSGGEEPYSIVMCLREAGLGFQQFQIDAADISEAALQKARAGRYGLRSIRVVPPAIRDRYFRITLESVDVIPEIRQAVRFTRANIMESPSVLRSSTYDAVFCRNLFIYLTKAARRRVIRNIDQSLVPGGLLFVGHAEMSSEFEAFFEPLRQRGAFAYGRRSVAAPASLRAEAAQPVALGSVPVHARTTARSPKIRAGKLSPVEALSDAAAAAMPFEHRLRVSLAAPHEQASRDELVHKVSELSNASRYAEAIEICERQLRQNGPSSQVYHVLGMVLQAAGLHEKAAQALERAVYLDPHHEEALLALALFARRRGDVEVADRFQQRSQRAHDRSQSS